MPHGYKKTFGDFGEHEAERFLCDQGFEVVERNFRGGRAGEIDLVVKKENLLVFVEVKARVINSFGGALYSISDKKKKSLRAAARVFLFLNTPLYDKADTRFDLVAFENGETVWIKDILR
jgi:putative endonuclease